MANTFRINRRSATGAAGAPSLLAAAELAFNEKDKTLYYGFGDNGSGTATSIIAIGGDGAFAPKVYVDDAVAAVSIPDGNKGDITVSSSGATWTINTGAVTYAKLGGAVPMWNQNTTGSAAKWTTARTLTVGGTGKAVDGTANVSWSLPEIFSASQTARAVLAAPTGAAGAPAFRALTAGDLPDLSGVYQPLDAELTAIAGLVSSANKIPRFTGAGAADMLSYSTSTSLAENSDTVVASQKAVKAYVDGLIAANDAMVFKGVINASTNPNYPAADSGHTYRISVAGKIGGPSGPNVESGDMLVCTVDGSAAGTHAAVGANWAIIQTNIDGALTTADIGVSVQAQDATLQSLAGLATAANQGLYLTATDTFATFSLTAGGRALGGVAGTANTFPYFSAANVVTLGSITAAGRTVLAAVDATAQRTALGLGSMATQNANAVAITGGTIDGIVLDGGTF